MNLFNLSWKSILHKPWATLLSVLLFALGIGLVTFLLLLQKQVQDNFKKNLAGIDLVIGAKGSPLQLVMSSMYHIDAPTGNIRLSDVRPYLKPNHPFIEQAIPLALGDSYRGYRLVGTTPDFFNLYKAKIATGQSYSNNLEVTAGAAVADALDLQIGDQFHSSHGFDHSDHATHDETTFKIVGILQPTGAIIDQLLLTTPQSFWLTHGKGEERGEGHQHDNTQHDEGISNIEGNNPQPVTPNSQPTTRNPQHDEGISNIEHRITNDEGNNPQPVTPNSQPATRNPQHINTLHSAPDNAEITALLVKFRGRNFQALSMPRKVNKVEGLQAATPAIEINRLYSLMHNAEMTLRVLAGVIIVVSGLSIFIALFSSLRKRRYELALMRVMGAGASRLFLLIILEGLLIAILGCIAGLMLGHLGMYFLAQTLEDAYRYSFSAWHFLREEWLLISAALGIGFLAALLPAIQAARTDISTTLTKT